MEIVPTFYFNQSCYQSDQFYLFTLFLEINSLALLTKSKKVPGKEANNKARSCIQKKRHSDLINFRPEAK